MENNKKKIAFVSDAVYPYNKGGKEKRLYDITTRLAKDGYDVAIYCMKWWDGPETIMQNGVNLCAISPLYPLYHEGRRSIKQGILFALHCLKLIGKKFDIMEVDHMPHMVLFTTKIVCLLKGKKMIAVWHEVWGLDYWKKYLGRLGYIAYAIERLSVILPDLILSVSDHTKDKLEKMLSRKNGVVVITNGIDVSKITNIAPAEKKSDIIFAGRLLSHKNVDVLLRAVKIITETNPNIKVLIIGDGPERNNLENLSKQLKLEKNVEFTGFIEKEDDVYALMHASKVFVLPSTREGFGITVIEANACGLPVITTDHEDNASRDIILNNENGRLCDLNENILADGMQDLLKMRKNPEYYREYVKKYDWVSIICEIEKIY